MAIEKSPAFVLRTVLDRMEVDQFTLKNWGFSREYFIELTLVSPSSIPKIGDAVCLEVDDVFFHGYIRVINESYSDQIHELNLCIVSPLAHFLDHCITRIYSDVLLNDLLEMLLSAAGLMKGLQFDLKMSSSTEQLWLQQKNESSLTFLHQLMLAYGLKYNYQQTKDTVICIFSDSMKKLAPNEPVRLTLNHLSGLINQNEVSRAALHSQLCSKHVVSHAYKSEDTQLVMSSVQSEQGFSLGCMTQNEARERQRPASIQSLQDELSVSLAVSLSSLEVLPGQQVQMNHAPIPHSHYYISTIELTGNQLLAASAKEQDEEEGLQRERLSVNLNLSNVFSGLPPLRNSRSMKSYGVLHTARVEHDKSAYPGLSETGSYNIRLHHDDPPEKAAVFKANEHGNASQNIRNSLYFSGNNYGFSYPLQNHSEVLIGYLNGDQHTPIILGALPNKKNQSVVTNKNHSDNIIRSKSGNTFQISQTYNECTLKLSSADSFNTLIITQGNDRGNITFQSNQGNMTIKSQDTMHFSAGSLFCLYAKNAASLWVKDKIKINSRSDSIGFHSKTVISKQCKNNFQLNAPQQLFTADNAIRLKAQLDMQFSAGSRLVLSSLRGTQFWDASGGNIHIIARNMLLMNGGGSKITINPLNISLQTAGIISLNAVAIAGI